MGITSTPPAFLVPAAPSSHPDHYPTPGEDHAGRLLMDRLLAGALLLLLLPALLLLVTAVRLSSPGPILFRQRRVGRHGQPFDILKFRSMRLDGPAAAFVPVAGCAPGGVEGVDRRTAVGRFLRRSSLDELPQLVNVLRGEMALVGPRPERPEFVELFADEVPGYTERHHVRPGITGLAQVRGLRGQTSIAARTRADLEYLERRSLALDLRVLARTVRAAVVPPATHDGAPAMLRLAGGRARGPRKTSSAASHPVALTPAPPARVLVADDHPIFRERLVSILDAHPELCVVAEASGGRAALEKIERLRPEIAVLADEMPDLDGARILHAIARDRIETRVVLLSGTLDPGFVYQAIAEGARAILSKQAEGEEIARTVASVARGSVELSPDVQTRLAAEIRERERTQTRAALTGRELEILQLTADGLSAPAIADELTVGVTTVKTHLGNVYEKLGVGDRAAAVAAAMRRGLMS